MLEPITITRVVSTPSALDTMQHPADGIVLRTAPDEAMVVGVGPDDVAVDDDHAIVSADGGWSGVWLDADSAVRLLAAGADWHPEPDRPVLAQGMLLQLPIKLWLETDRTLLLTQHAFAADLAERIGAVS